jgi:hypothetical protein
MEDKDALSNLAEIQYSVLEKGPVVHLTVPKGTKLTQLDKVTNMLSRELIPKLVPRGCQACLSGADYFIRERLENVLHVDLATGKIGQKLGG